MYKQVYMITIDRQLRILKYHRPALASTILKAYYVMSSYFFLCLYWAIIPSWVSAAWMKQNGPLHFPSFSENEQNSFNIKLKCFNFAKTRSWWINMPELHIYTVFEIRGSKLVVLRTTKPKKLIVRTQNQVSKASLTKICQTFMNTKLYSNKY